MIHPHHFDYPTQTSCCNTCCGMRDGNKIFSLFDYIAKDHVFIGCCTTLFTVNISVACTFVFLPRIFFQQHRPLSLWAKLWCTHQGDFCFALCSLLLRLITFGCGLKSATIPFAVARIFRLHSKSNTCVKSRVWFGCSVTYFLILSPSCMRMLLIRLN